MLSDAELVEAAQRGDVMSLGSLLERHRASLYGLALHILGHGPEAQDAVHEAFLVALQKIDQVREPEAVGRWLGTVLRNVCRMKLRQGRGELLFDELPRHVEAGSSESQTEEFIDHLALREWVWAALAKLPESLRVTVMLRYFGGCSSYEEISAVLGVPVGTVCSRLSQARNKLADSLLETVGEDHAGVRREQEARARFFSAAYDEYNRGHGYQILANAFSNELVLALSNGKVFLRGHEFLLKDLEGDLEAGLKMHPTNVVSNGDIAVIECDVENPRDNPYRCPPALSQVAFYRDGKIRRMHWYLAPRPRRDGCWEESVLEPLAAEAG